MPSDSAEDFLEFPADLVPQSGILRDLIALWEKTTDADSGFLFASALILLSIVVGPKAVISGGIKGTYLNLWIVLVAVSTFGRKSTCMDFVKFHAEALSLESGIMPTTTPEGLFALADEKKREMGPDCFQNSGAMILDELSTFTGSLGKEYMRTHADQLLSAYDGTSFRTHTKGGGRIDGKFEGLSILAGTQPRRLEITEEGMASGFLARWNFFFSMREKSPGELLFRRPAINSSALDLVNSGLNKLRGLDLQIVSEPETEALYEKWFVQEVTELDPENMLAPYYQRNLDHAWKIAALLSISEGQTSIGARQLRNAIRVIEWQRHNVRIFISRNRASPAEKLKERLFRKLDRGGGEVLRTQLMRDMNLLAREVDSLVGPLLERRILVAERTVTVEGIQTVIYRRVEKEKSPV